MNEIIIDCSRVLLSLVFLIYASVSDFKKREVSNTVWAVFAPLALVLTFLQIYTIASTSSIMLLQQTLIMYALSFSIIFALSYTIFYFGAFGGADAKALMCIAVALPTYPVNFLQPQFGFVPPLFPLTVFSNGVLFASVSVAYALTRNLLWKLKTRKQLFEGLQKESKLRKAFALLCGYKVKAEMMEHKQFLYPLEDVENGTEGENRKLIMMPSDDKRDEVVQRITGAVRRGELQDEIWVTPGLPLLVFITGGFVVAIFWGDMVWAFLRLILLI